MYPKASKLFSRRLAYWTGQGLSGADVYKRLAEDDELPISFEPTDAAEIMGIIPSTLKKHRNRGSGPDFIRTSERAVRYPRAAFCHWLARRYVKVGHVTREAVQ